MTLDPTQAWEVLEALPDPVFLVDGNGELVFSTTAAARLLGWDVDSWTGRSVLDLVHPDDLAMVLGEVVAGAGRAQLRMAETEKYPHVTYFFNGGVERAFPKEDRKIVPSPKVATYDLQPEMSARPLTDEVLARIADYDLIILNFANPDMVGHTGIIEAGIKAVETADECCARIITKLLDLGGKCIVTADHGNCEQMRNPDGSPNTAHTTNLVHFIYVAKDAAQFRCDDGILADVAPTLLFLLGMKQPAEMTGHNLLVAVSEKRSG